MHPQVEELPRYKGPTRRCLHCGHAFHLREIVLVHISNENEVFCNNPTEQSCSASYYQHNGREVECVWMLYTGRGINGAHASEFLLKYRGDILACVHCDRRFREGDPVRILAESVVLCAGSEYHCVAAYVRKHGLQVRAFGSVMRFVRGTFSARVRYAWKRVKTSIRNGPPVGFTIFVFIAAVVCAFLFAIFTRP